MNTSLIPDGTILSIGDDNWDCVLTSYGDGSKKYVRAVPKKDKPGCKESGFGDISYWACHVTNHPEQETLTEAGKAFYEEWKGNHCNYK